MYAKNGYFFAPDGRFLQNKKYSPVHLLFFTQRSFTPNFIKICSLDLLYMCYPITPLSGACNVMQIFKDLGIQSGNLSGWESVWVGICLDGKVSGGELSGGELSGWGTVWWGSVGWESVEWESVCTPK